MSQESLLSRSELESLLRDPTRAYLRRLRRGVRLLSIGGWLSVLIFTVSPILIFLLMPSRPLIAQIDAVVFGASGMSFLGCFVVRSEFRSDIRRIERHL